MMAFATDRLEIKQYNKLLTVYIGRFNVAEVSLTTVAMYKIGMGNTVSIDRTTLVQSAASVESNSKYTQNEHIETRENDCDSGD